MLQANNQNDLPGLRRVVEDVVRRAAGDHRGRAKYREPVIGYADASDPRWEQLTEGYVPGHLAPADLLPGARSVVCFFLPFDESIVAANRASALCADEWAAAYIETNALLASVCEDLQRRLAEAGVRTAWQNPTHDYDPVRLCARWSHKSAAVIAGVGRLGLNHLLITERGCAGRISSIVVDVPLHEVSGPTPAAGDEPIHPCGFFSSGRCRACVAACPASAISDGGLDKARCNNHCGRVEAYLTSERGLPGPLAICGRCATGPCALSPFSAGTHPA